MDARFAHLSFRVDGYQAAEGIQPGFEYTSMTLEGDSLNMTGGGFFDNLHADGNGNFTYTDGTPAKETADGSIIGKYINDDGSMEYIMTVMTTDKDKSLIGKPIHIELQNLGTLGQVALELLGVLIVDLFHLVNAERAHLAALAVAAGLRIIHSHNWHTSLC